MAPPVRAAARLTAVNGWFPLSFRSMTNHENIRRVELFREPASADPLLRMARLAEPLMTDGGCLLTTTFYGAEKVVELYNLMGPCESCV
jgi:hypothetical protein